ncbi:hypothetical protein [Yoonia sp. 208BN28-4]|uniref:hypothetical protein n=1 Tax=Yoonia sp. 208BN28-4 TaxID=3126505 RepID=UPI0030B42873
MAETVTCSLSGPCADFQACGTTGADLEFTIDRTQFAPAIDADEPPRRKLSIVQLGQAQFPAEPFIISDTIGFSAEAFGGAPAIFAMQPDGTGTYAVARHGYELTGPCEVTE